MKQYEFWETCIQMIEEGRVIEAEKYGIEIAGKLGLKPELLDKIFSVNLKSYEKKIDSKMTGCIERAKAENAVALCLYYSMDNGWESTIYFCKNYTHENSSWISTSGSWLDIGKARGFSGIYKKEAESAFFCDDISSAICLLLMLRTTIAFYNVAKNYKDCGLKLCITATESDFVRVV